MKHLAKPLWIVAMLVATPVLAEEAGSPDGAAKTFSVTIPAEGSLPSAKSPAARAQAASQATPPTVSPSVESGKLEDLAAKSSQLEKALADEKAARDKASKLKISGFVQGRYEWHQDSVNGWNFDDKPAASATFPSGNAGSSSKSTFYIRRARLDTMYSGTNAELVLQLDAGGDSVGLRDAEAAFVDTWTPLHLRVSVGQFKYPFGYELQQSDPVREMPERARMIQQFFPGERDRGLKVQGSYQWLRFQIALVNGNGIQDPIFKAGKDSNAWLDLVGRVGADFQVVSGGVSGYYSGSDLYNPNYNATTNPDTNPMNLKRYARVRIGGDLQGNVDVPSLGNLSLRGEIIYSSDTNKAYNGVPADSCQDRVGLGFSLIAAQNIGSLLGAVVRVDSYDPLLQGSLDASTCQKISQDGKASGTYVTAGIDRVITVGGGLLLYVSPNFKASFIYEHPTEQGSKKVDNDIFTAQLQARF
jgi:hypothetical protein